jgi:gluconokinase
MTAGTPLDDADRAPWLRAIGEHLARCLARQESTIVACSALKEKYRRDLLSFAPAAKVVYLKGSPETLHQRISERRGHFMKPEMLDSQLTTLEEPADALSINIEQSPDEIVERIRQAFGV